MITDWFIPILVHVTSAIRVIVVITALISGLALASRFLDYNNDEEDDDTRMRKDEIASIYVIVFSLALFIGIVFPSWERVEMMIVDHYSTPENISKFPSEDAFYNQLGLELGHTIYFKPHITK